MVAINFPVASTVGEEFIAAGVTYIWNGTGWKTKGTAGGTGTIDAYSKIESDSKFVDIAGDVMTGNLTVNKAAPAILVDKVAAGQPAHIVGKTSGLNRWDLIMGDQVAESGSNTGSDFQLWAYDDVGNPLYQVLGITRAAGLIAVKGDPVGNLGVATKQYVDAAATSLDALAYNGLQINGGFEVSQEKGTAIGTSLSPQYICDGWRLQGSGTMFINANTAIERYFPGFPNFLNAIVTTAQASLGSGDFMFMAHFMEGLRIARLAWGTAQAQPLTIAFWSMHHRTGLYSVSIRNGATNRSYIATYVQAVSDVAQYNTITIPGDVAGTWANDNTLGLYISFVLAAGTGKQTSSINTWLAGDFMAAPGQVNAVAATSDVFRITGVVVLPGIAAPSAARSAFIMRPFDQELELCKRYYQKTYSYNVVPGTPCAGGAGTIYLGGGASVNYLSGSIIFPVSMRAVPTLTIFNNAGGAGSGSYYNMSAWVNGLTVSVGGITTNGVGFFAASSGVVSLGNFDYTVDARL